MATKSQALALARKRYGPKAYITERRNAPTKAERERNIARRTAIAERKRAIDAEFKADPPNHPALLKAARFVVDVDGDNPSIPGLRAELERAERSQARMEERVALQDELLTLTCHSKRWTVLINRGFCGEIVLDADSLDELLTMLGAPAVPGGLLG